MRKKVGRPIAYKGDPNAANLTVAERRRIKRRMANRESARRVRARRQESLEELQIRVSHSALMFAYQTGCCMICFCWVLSVYMLCLLISLTSESHLQTDQISLRNGHMVKHIADVEGHTVLLKDQLEECERQWNKALAEMHACTRKFPLFVPDSRYILSSFCYPVHWPDGAGVVYPNTDAVNPQGLLAQPQ